MEPADEDLMGDLAGGDPGAFEKIYARYKTAVLNYFVRTTGAPEIAEELFQELFLRVYRGARKYEPRKPFRVWLFTLARNLLRDRWRRLGRAPEWEDCDRELADPGPDPEALAGAREEVDRLRRAVLQLPPGLREALVLRRYHGLSFAEIGEILSCSEGAARVRVFRALERLRVILAATAGAQSQERG